MEIIARDNIKTKIHTIRGLQVMFDRDLAKLYGVETRVLNQAVKRNIARFPSEFMFQLKENEINILKSQIVMSSWGGRRTNPVAFTEQGVAMLSAVLRSDTAVRVSIQIINAFIAMRRFIGSNAQIFQRLDTLEIKQHETDKKIEGVLNAIESKEIKPKQGIFFDGQIFDAYNFVSNIIRSAKESIILIDNFVDDSVLTLFSKRRDNVGVTIYTKNITKQLRLDLERYNSQYPLVELREFEKSHDRFMIIDDKEVYHIGASLKDLGKKWFAFSKFDKEVFEILNKLG